MNDFEERETEVGGLVQEAREMVSLQTVELKPATLRERLVLLIVTAVVLIADQTSKYIVEATLPIYESWAPIPAIASIFRFTHATNTGAAFGLFPGGSAVFMFIATIVAIGIIYYNYKLPQGNRVLRIALGLQLGGALGNLTDRFRLGHVTDFLDFGPWPVFNLADTSVVAGVILLGWLMLKGHERYEAKTPTADEVVSGVERTIGPFETPDEWPAD